MKKKEPSLEEKLLSLPLKKGGRKWTPEMDRLLLNFVPDKGAPAVASILGIPSATARDRYQKLKALKK